MDAIAYDWMKFNVNSLISFDQLLLDFVQF